jgi:phosphoglycerol transferase MdoB-like AlkP superfamily enzyme
MTESSGVPASVTRVGLVALVLANLFVALQALWHEWGYYQTLLIYWTEVAIFGGFNLLRMLVVGLFGAEPMGSWAGRYVDPGSRLNRLFFTLIAIGFFVVKFATFAFIIGLFVLLTPALLVPEGTSGAMSVHRALSSAGPGFLIAVAGLALSHAVSFVRSFLMEREYDRVSVMSLMFWPYARMSLVGIVLLVGVGVAPLFPGLSRETAFAVVMVLLKLGADAVSHVVQQENLAQRSIPMAQTGRWSLAP